MTTRSRAGTESRKQAVSIRMSRSDVRQIKRLAERLGARDSDVVRFAIKMMLGRLAPLHDPAACGRTLVPVLVESGTELMRHFDLDATRLTGIVNNGAEAERRVDPEDIQLLAMTGVQRSYVRLQVAGLRRHQHLDEVDGGRAGAADAVPAAFDARAQLGGSDTPEHTLRQYLCDKYLSAGSAGGDVKNSGGDL